MLLHLFGWPVVLPTILLWRILSLGGKIPNRVLLSVLLQVLQVRNEAKLSSFGLYIFLPTRRMISIEIIELSLSCLHGASRMETI